MFVPPVSEAIVKSGGGEANAGRKGGAVTGCRSKSARILAWGLRAIFSAAVAVSPGRVPLAPALRALVKSVVQAPEPGPLELMHAARIFAIVWIILRDGSGVVREFTNPVDTLASRSAIVNRSAREAASEPDTCVASMA